MTRILVIEDADALREEILLLLSLEGYEAIGAADGERGLALCRSEEPDLVVCDVMLPGLSGFEVCSRLREDETFDTTPFVFLTARTAREDRRRGMELGADDYLTKPFRSEELLAAIESRLRLREAMRARIRRVSRVLGRASKVTALPDRDALTAELLVRHETGEGWPPGVLVVLGLDRFRYVNESHGLEAGDRILRRVGERLREALPATVKLFSVGGDRFAVLGVGRGAPSAVDEIEAAIEATFADPFKAGDSEAALTASVGVALCAEGEAPPTGACARELDCTPLSCLFRAEAALALAKERGRNTTVTYAGGDEVAGGDHLTLAAKLRRALQQGELSLVFQPQVSLDTNRVVGVEALARWSDADLGPVSPSVFIDVAEHQGLIHDIGEWVLGEACAATRAILDAGHELTCSVNLSPRQWDGQDVLALVSNALEGANLPARHLCLELTESGVMHNSAQAIAVLQSLRDLGVGISMDDFGTGFSSLSQLRNLPLTELKIDRAFMQGLETDPSAKVIAEAIVAVGLGLDLTVVVEGVETEAHLQWARARRAHRAQGFLLGRPVPLRTLLERLESTRPAR